MNNFYIFLLIFGKRILYIFQTNSFNIQRKLCNVVNLKLKFYKNKIHF